MKAYTLLIVLLITAFITGCASNDIKPEQDATDFPTLIKQAEAAIDKANSVGSEWRDSRKLLEQAKEAEKAGDTDKAMELARQAKHQGELGYAQGQSQKKAGPWLF